MTVGETPQEAYKRGEMDGGIAERLAEYGRHFDRINGSQEKVAEELQELPKLRQEIQRVADGVESSAIAQRDLEAALRRAGAARWSPVERLIAVVVTFTAVVSAVASVVSLIAAN